MENTVISDSLLKDVNCQFLSLLEVFVIFTPVTR